MLITNNNQSNNYQKSILVSKKELFTHLGLAFTWLGITLKEVPNEKDSIVLAESITNEFQL